MSCVSAVLDIGTAAQLLCPCFPEILSFSLEYIIGDYHASKDTLRNSLGFKNGSCCEYQHCFIKLNGLVGEALNVKWCEAHEIFNAQSC